MRAIHLLLLAALLPLLVSCRSLVPSSTAKQNKELTAIAESRRDLQEANYLYETGKYDEALVLLDKVDRKPYLQAESRQLRTAILYRQAEPKVKQGKEYSSQRAILEVGERLVMPESFGETRSIEPGKPLPPLPPGPMEELVNRKVDIRLESANVQAIVTELSRISKLNIIADDALAQAAEKTLTLQVTNTPLREILSYISRNMGVAFHLGENIIWVTKADDKQPTGPELITRVIPLSAGYTPAAPGGGAAATSSSSNSLANLGSSSSASSSGNSTDELLQALQDFFQDNPDNPPNAKFVLYRSQNMLVVRNTPANIRAMDQIIGSFDKPRKQVLIEARFITISQSDLFQIGSTFNNLSYTNPGNNRTFAASTALPAAGDTISDPGTLKMTGVLDRVSYDAVLTAFAQVQSSRTLEAPQITVLNDQTASIHRGDKRYYFETYDLQSSGGDNPATSLVPSGDATELQLGVTLSVHPSIGNDNRTITMSIESISTSFIEWETLSETIVMPRTNDNTIQTSAVVHSGETVVLGGMLSTNEGETVNKVPLLGDIPWLGFLFRKKDTHSNPQHLMIFVKATILDPDGAMNVVPADAAKAVERR